MSTANNIADMLFDLGIKPKRWGPGISSQVLCPECQGGNTRETSLTVTIDEDNHGATWLCHRGTCGWKGGQRLRVDNRPVTKGVPGQPRRPPPHPPAVTDNKPDWLYEFFAARNIGARVVDAFGCYATQRWFSDDLPSHPAIVFPYFWRGEVVNRKYRPCPGKQPQAQEKDATPTLYNVDSIGDSVVVYWVEGEPDVMALAECGVTPVVSLKDGAGGAGGAQDKRLAALDTHADVLQPIRQFVLAGDMDTPGLALREELARRLGRHRCWLVSWPEGCKDAGGVLLRDGPEAVLDALGAAQPYPIDGLQRITSGRLHALRRLPAPATMTTGTVASNAILRLPTEGRLIVVTGIPNHGKTAWTRFIMVHTAATHGRRWAAFSPEQQPWEQFAAECAEVRMGKPFWDRPGIPGMSDAEVAEAGAWLGEHITMLVSDAEDDAPTLEWILDRARYAVLRDGVTDLLIDPWNEIDHNRGAMTETDYIGRALQRFKAFGLRHGCNVWIVAHPAKPPPLKPGDKRPAPGPYDLAGSAHWANKTDLGVTLHAPKLGVAELHVWKTRFRRWGKRETVAVLEFDELTGRYGTPVAGMTDGPSQITLWQD